MKYLLALLVMFTTFVLALAASPAWSNSDALAASQSTLSEIKAVQFHDGNVITAGLPTAEQISALSEAGVDLVINLIPKNNPHAIGNEQQLVQDAGMAYINIEVDWQQPKSSDVEQFFAAMEQNKTKSVFVHCAANYRASAFYYLYLDKLTPRQVNQAQIMAPWGDLQQSLKQYPQWQQLIEKMQRH
ncbi:protein tyrosine phosphatase family protein [Shewanella sp. Scap07]|uniref:protein tyrosine phosphatase family protein n=1 Tax=Shewanella sp. Scap07 TaxID=2589987 RepID=UPI0015BC5E42|nr:protein tyrosine phosphatase family protein [Shewanella sp. Scap07]